MELPGGMTLTHEQEGVYAQLQEIKAAGGEGEAAFLKLKLIKTGLENEVCRRWELQRLSDARRQYKVILAGIRECEAALEENQGKTQEAEYQIAAYTSDVKAMEAEAATLGRSITSLSTSIEALKEAVEQRKQELAAKAGAIRARLGQESSYVETQRRSTLTEEELQAEDEAACHAVAEALVDVDMAILKAQADIAAIREARASRHSGEGAAQAEAELFQGERSTEALEEAAAELRAAAQ